MTSYPRELPPRSGDLQAPRFPAVPSAHPFPVLATVAPMFAAVALWLITSSPYALIFAALGPVIAVASVGDSRLTARRTRRRELARYLRECDAAVHHITEAHDDERGALDRLAPAAGVILGATAPDPKRWSAVIGDPVLVSIGRGTVAAALRFSGDRGSAADAGESGVEVTTRMAELEELARELPNAAIVVDARHGIGVWGSAPLATAAARSLLVQLTHVLPPASTTITVTGSSPLVGWSWLKSLPHPGSTGTERADSPHAGEATDIGGLTTITLARTSPGARSGSDGADNCVIAIAGTLDDLPRGLRVVLHVGGPSATLSRFPVHTPTTTLTPELVSREEAGHWARQLKALAVAEGLVGGRAIPHAVELDDLLDSFGSETSTTGLDAAIGIASSGPIFVDLVHDGPHAIIGGTTGSGKSELLISWALALAARRPPSEVCFLFVDFKGGASFDSLRRLPHCVGVITDLDAHEVLRALASLRAELQRRERLLAAHAIRSIDDVEPGQLMPRLVIVVDEYAAMVDAFPELHTLFSDLAARGRSLGIHLVLCTQRPGGVVRDQILANCGIRISLRVNNRADSLAVLDSDAAALIAAGSRGRALLSAGGADIREFQVARSSERNVHTIASRWAGQPPPDRPWSDPLPTRVEEATLLQRFDREPGAVLFALADQPQHQRHSAAHYRPDRDGNLLITGAAGAGKSGVLAALASSVVLADGSGGSAVCIGPDLPAVWDTLHRMMAESTPGRILLLDDVDTLLALCPEDYTLALVDLLTRMLREGPSLGIHTVMTVQRLSGALHSLASLCGSSLVMRMPNRQEHLLAGADAASWDDHLGAGGAFWHGERIQVAVPSAHVGATAGPGCGDVDAAYILEERDRTSALLVVSTRPAAFAKLLRNAAVGRRVIELDARGTDARGLLIGHGGDADVLVGDPDSWQSRWGVLAALRQTVDVLLDGCSVAEVRAVAGVRELPPPPGRGERALWLLRADGGIARVRNLSGSAPPATPES